MAFASGITRAWHDLHDDFQWLADWRDRYSVFLLRDELAVVELRRAARRSGIARYFHCRRRRLRLAHGLLFPGFLPRRESVARAGAESVRLLLGTIPLLFMAGMIEGFVSPTEIAVWLKFAMAAALFTLLLAYLFWKSAPSAKADSAA